MKNATRPHPGALSLGSNVVELLLPQRRPMLMVDRIDSFVAMPAPALEASRHISANEVFFGGHFPGLHLWPGCLTIEGMGQTGQLLVTLLAVRQLAAAESGDPEAAIEALANLELGFRLHPGYRAEEGARFLSRLRELRPSLAVGAGVDVKLLQPVFAGQRLDYRATLAGEFGDMVRTVVEASVAGTVVARGSMTGARVRAARPAPPEG
jgi:3-hydroxyacyl-[acyl-carrier-protein] dehydratase